MSDRALDLRTQPAPVDPNRHRSPAGPPRASARPWAALRLQRTAGNAAMAALLQRTGKTVVQRTPDAAIANAAYQLHEALVLKNVVPVENVFNTILLQKGRGKELRDAYTENYQRDLMKDLEKLGADDTIRGQRYLEFGTLRPADKIYFTISGWGVDVTTMETVLSRLHGDIGNAESDFERSYGDKLGHRTETLPTKVQSTIAGAVVAHIENSSVSHPWEITKAKALLAYGTLRPADKVRIATVGRVTNETEMLIKALLQNPDVAQVKADYKASYDEELEASLVSETWPIFKERDVAKALLAGGPIEDRAIQVIKIATGGLKSAPEYIWWVLGVPMDLGKVKTAVEAGLKGEGVLKDITATFGGLGKEDLDRLKAMVGIGGEGILADPDVQLLQKAGGTGSGSVFEVLKMSAPPEWSTFKAAMAKPPFEKFVSMYCSPPEKAWLSAQVFAETKARINWTFENPGNTDYLVHIIASFTDSTTRRELTRDTAFMNKVKDLGTANANKVLLVLAPSDMTPLERAAWLNEAIGRETGNGVGSITNAAEAVNDENRELQAAVGRAKADGKPLTAKQLEEINAMAATTEGSLRAFLSYRDELEATVDTVAGIAVGLVVGIATAGAGAVEGAALAVARAAAASAMSRVVTKKVIMGDRFDVIGADGAAAFVAGAVDGALNVIGGVVTAGVATEAKDAAGEAIRVAAPAAFRNFAANTGKKMLENAVTGGLSSAVEAAAQDTTWQQGAERGLKTILTNSLVNAAVGAGITGAVSAVTAGMQWREKLAKVRSLPPDEQKALIAQAIDVEGVGPTLRKTGHGPEELRDLVGHDSPAGQRITEYLGRGAGTLDGPELKNRLRSISTEPVGQRGPIVENALDVLGPAETNKNIGLATWAAVSESLGAESTAMNRLRVWRDGLAEQAEAAAAAVGGSDPVLTARGFLAAAAGFKEPMVEAALGVTVSLAMQGEQLAEGMEVAMGAEGASIDLVKAVGAVLPPAPVQKVVQRIGPPGGKLPELPTLAPGLKGYDGSDFEIAVAQALEAGAFAQYRLPAMRVVPGIHNPSGHGIDLIGVSRVGGAVTFWVIECKFVREGGSHIITLGRGQMTTEWIRGGMTKLLGSDEFEAEDNQNELRTILKEAYGSRYREAMMGDALIDHIAANARRVVVHPFYAEQSQIRIDVNRINTQEHRTGKRAVAVLGIDTPSRSRWK